MEPGSEREDEDREDSTHVDDPGRFDEADTTGEPSPLGAEGELEDELDEPRRSIEEEEDRPA